MFNLDEAIRIWLKGFRKHRAFDHGSIREMEIHIKDHIDDLMASGYSEKEAFEKAIDDFGEISPMGNEEFSNQLSKTSYISINNAMLKNYFKIAIRNFVNQKFYALINITGLTIGLAVVFLIGLFVIDELNFDRFHKKADQLYRVVENQYYAEQPAFPVAVTPTALAPAIKDKYPEILNFTRVSIEEFRFEIGDKSIQEESGVLVDEGFFDMFTFPFVHGGIQGFVGNTNALIINEELSKKYFPDKENPVGEQIKVDGDEFTITGVIADVPKNSHLDIRYIVPFKKYLVENPDRVNSWASNWLYTYVETTPNLDLEAFNDKVKGLIKENNEGSVTEIYLQPMTDIHLGLVDFVVEVGRKGEMVYVKVFALVAIFILLISCINFMNLSTARSAKRAKEVGLRKTVGAGRGQLIFQFLSESILFTLISVLLAVGIVIAVLPAFNELTNKQFDIMLLVNADYGIAITFWVLFIAFITGLLAGSYPALYLSSVQPIQILGSSKSQSMKGGTLMRKGLVIIQFVISVVLIIGTLVVYKQLQFIQTADLGYNKEDILYTFIMPEDAKVFANEIEKLSSVIGTGLANQHPAYVMSSSSGVNWPGANSEETILFHNLGVDENYLSLMQMEMVEGRNFTELDSNAIIINQKALETMGIKDPIGLEIDARGKRTIVGVVKDFNFKSIRTAIEPLIIYKDPNTYRLYIKYNPEAKPTIVNEIGSVWNKMYPDKEFDYYYLESDFNELYQAEQRTSTLSLIFAGFAILISCLGLFGLVAYAMEQRTKEVGIRKVLGASIQNLFLLLTSDFTKLVLLSLIVSIPLGWYLMDQWLSGFAYRVNMPIWVFVVSGAFALLIAIVTVGYQTIRASVNNPVKALRSE